MGKFSWLADRAKNVYSQFGEDGIVDAIFEKIGTTNRWCFECGASDGIFFSNTRRLVRDGWSAVLVESDASDYVSLVRNCEKFGNNIHLVNAQVTNIDEVLTSCCAPRDIDLVVIDVDGQDYHLFNSMLCYRPRVVMVEFDPNADDWFIPDIGGAGQAGFDAICRLAAGRFYTVVARTWCNAILVAQPLDQLLGEDS